MLDSLHAPAGSMVPQFWVNRVCLRQEFSRMGTAALRGEHVPGASRLEALLARELPHHDELRSARTKIAASAAHLPIAPAMAWALPQLLKRVQLVSPGILSTSAMLRSLILMPERDEQFAKAFADSGFMSCDRAIERVRWKYEIGEMMAKQHDGSAWEVLEHCRVLLAQHRTKQPVDWESVLLELQTLSSWFPELRTIQLLERLYARLYELHVISVGVVQCWLDWRAGMADTLPEIPAFQGAHDA